ncbi:rhodanese-like domain-containing protein [Asaia astilbis]|uniref:hypothetical protein n=1 Tax=Asaia astilbis TaxID=610244 RepID=UPI000688C48E|nr:hypothetical protein [Asaia astilbis]
MAGRRFTRPVLTGQAGHRSELGPYDAAGFAQALRDAIPSLQTPILFLCRSGMRSQQTAELAAHLGYETSVNIIEGYEGPPDSSGQRGRVCGWQFQDLPRYFPD